MCKHLTVEVQEMTYTLEVKNVGEVTIENFPMLVCTTCGSQWIDDRGDQAIADAINKKLASSVNPRKETNED